MPMSFNVSRIKSFRVDNHCRQRGFNAAEIYFWSSLANAIDCSISCFVGSHSIT
jgi:hypothetical protein